MNHKIILAVLIFLFHFVSSTAQSRFNVSGNVIDSTQTALIGATVVLLNEVDSVLIAFDISNQKGVFNIKKVKAGNYIMQITYLGYIPHFSPLTIQDKDVITANIVLFPQVSLLDEVTVKAEHVPIVINGDTIQYNAAAFQTRPNAVVEDLLKKLPGVEVERDGTVRAQGEVVENVLVDGKEFFGNDVRIPTRNLPADAIEKVEIFDKKSEMAEFSGIDDGQEEKTINLELKEGKKQGYFGKLSGGYGTDQRFTSKGNINRFSQKMQFSTIGMLNNINDQGFSINEYINFMGGLGTMMSSGGGSMAFNLNSDNLGLPLDFGNGVNGLLTTGAIGTNLNYEFSKKTELNGSYFYSQIKNTNDRNLSRQNFIGNDIYEYTELGKQVSQNHSHRLNLRLEHQLDSSSNIILRSNFGFIDLEGNSQKQSETFNPNKILENSSIQDYRSDEQNIRVESSLIYRRKLKKKGRFFVVNTSFGNRTSDNLDLIDARNIFLSPIINQTNIDSLNQDQTQENNQFNYSGGLSYTEPLGKGKYLEINFTHQNYSNDLTKDFYDQLMGERVFNPLLSNRFNQDYQYNRGGIRFRKNKKKSNLSTGLSLQHSALKGNIATLETTIKNDFLNLLPFLNWDYSFTSSRNLSLSYQSNVQQPTLLQLQPIVDNSDPLNIYIGNPDLNPEYIHNMRLSFMSFDQFNFTNFFGNINLLYTQDKITNAQNIDSLFRQSLMPINVKNDIYFSGNFSYSMPIRAIKSKINLRWNPSYNRRRFIVNQSESFNQLYINTLNFSIENRKKDFIDIVIGTSLTYNVSKYSERKTLNQSYLNQTYYIDLTLSPGKGWTFNTVFDYDIYSPENFGDKQTVALWQASISKLVWDNRLEIKLSAFDILNNNLGINRQSRSNYTQEERTRTIGQYFLLGMTYSLSKLNSNEGSFNFEISGR